MTHHEATTRQARKRIGPSEANKGQGGVAQGPQWMSRCAQDGPKMQHSGPQMAQACAMIRQVVERAGV